MALPFTFASQSGIVPASELDDNFLYLESLSTTNAATILSRTGVVSSPKITTYMVVAANFSKRISCTGTFTLSLDLAATLTNGFMFYISNDGAGIITIDPTASELIDGRSTIIVYPAERFMVWCDGTTFVTFGRARRVLTQTIATTAGTTADFEIFAADTELKAIQFTLDNVSNGGTNISARIKVAGAYATANQYSYSGVQYGTGAALTNPGNAAATSWPFAVAGVATIPEGMVRFSRLQVTTPNFPTGIANCNVPGSTGLQTSFVWAGTASALQGVRFFETGGGSFVTGTIYCYGERDN